MARIVLDPDDVNQDRVVTLTDGTVLELAAATAAQLRRVARQLHVHRSTYAHAYRGPDEATTTAVAAGTRDLDDVGVLHRAVQERLEAVRGERGGRRATDLDPTVLLDTTTWASSAGIAQPLTDLTPSHRRNLLAWLERTSDGLRDAFAAADIDPAERARVVPADPWVAGTPLYRRLRELVDHESALELAKDQARQQARQLIYDRTGRWPGQ